MFQQGAAEGAVAKPVEGEEGEDGLEDTDGGPDSGSEKLGNIQFSVSYKSKDMTLTLKIIRATDLAAKDMSGTSDPYVKVMLLPDKKTETDHEDQTQELEPALERNFRVRRYAAESRRGHRYG